MKHSPLVLFRVSALLAAFLSLHGCSGCVGSTHNTPGAESSGRQSLTVPPVSVSEYAVDRAESLPAENDFSADADIVYAYLCFLQAIHTEDEEALLQAAERFTTPEVPAKVWLEGGVWLMSRKSPNAVSLLKQAIAAWPQDLSLNLLYAEACMESGRLPEGIALMRGYLKQHADALDARLELALLLVKNNEYVEAEKLLMDISVNERTPLVDYYHSKALSGMGRQNEAVLYLRKAVRGMPYFVEALAELAFIYEQRSEFKEARNIYERLLKLNFSPQDVALRLISLSLQLNQPEKALKYLQAGPKNLKFRLMAISMFARARHYLQAENLLKCIEAEGDASGEVYLLLADMAYEQRRDLALALSWLQKVTADSVHAGRAHLLRAQMLADSGKDEESLGAARSGQHRFADMPDFWELEIRLLARRKHTANAISVTQTALKKWPGNAELNFLLASLFDEAGDKKNAFTLMETILKTNPDNYQALNYVGYTLAEENRDLERAVQLLVKADNLSPNQSYIVDSLAWALFRIGRVSESWAEIRRAVSLDSHIAPSIWEHYGDIASHIGLKDEARKAYQNALDLKPANTETLRQRLAQP
ncbi:MAG: tetratricopeptide repeat protein [Desulfovibrio sp.]|jgi:Flp pilus assembly protein TadD|nr:tetratricopeptide repeat protein [Desulfovibrio sp.]